MPANLNFFDNYTMMAILEEATPRATFFRDRYFPTAAGDIFAADKVLTEYRKGDRRMAAFVDQRVGDIPMERQGYEIHEFQPAYIGISRTMTVDDLAKRGFGEALYPGLTRAQRAAQLIQQDLVDMENRIVRREEWMAAQVMLNNACAMQNYIDSETKGELLNVKFYDEASDHKYTVATKWDEGGNIRADVTAMCRLLSKRSLPAQDLLLGSEVAEVFLANQEIRDLLNKQSGIIMGEVNQSLTQYDGVVFMGRLNFGGFLLNVFTVDERYVSDEGKDEPLFPADGVMVTAPNCGHIMYGQISQIDYGDRDYTTYVAKRVPKLVVDQDNNSRKVVLASRPLAAPINYCPYIFAEKVISLDP